MTVKEVKLCCKARFTSSVPQKILSLGVRWNCVEAFGSRGMLLLAFYDSDSLLEIGHISGILYLRNLVAELSEDTLKSKESAYAYTNRGR